MLNLDHLKSFYGEYPIGDPDINTTTNSDVLLNSREILEYYKSKKYSSILDTTRGVNEFINALTYTSEEKDENGNVIHYQNDPRNIFLKDYTSLIARLLKTTGTQKYFELIDILYHAHLMDTDFTESELSATEYIYANPHKIKRIETRATWFVYRKIRANEFYGDSIKMSCQFILPYSMNLKSYDIKLEYIANERYDAPTAPNEVSIRELKLLVEIHEKPGDHKDNENDYNKLAIASFHRYSVVYFPQNKFVTVEDYEARWKELDSCDQK